MAIKLSEEERAQLDRLLAGLKKSGVEQGARNKTVAEKTGYKEKTVGNILSGNAYLTDRFIQAVCRVFKINVPWVLVGQEQTFVSESVSQAIQEIDAAPHGPRNYSDKMLFTWFGDIGFEERLRIFNEEAAKITATMKKRE
jgi:transcriptional regulator with XRE-family HTH domain